MAERVYNFSPGPAVLPVSVLEAAQRDLLALPGVGMSVLEISHRSPPFERILQETQDNLRTLLAIPANYKILFLQGGSLLQFSMIAMNFLRRQELPADYVVTGTWGKKALADAKLEGPARAAWDGAASKYDHLPAAADIDFSPQAPYIHTTSNETIQGVQFAAAPPFAGAAGNAPIICDASSDFLCRPMPVDQYGMIYACAQKNAGPAGVTVAIVREDLLARSPSNLPGILSYAVMAENNSLFNTPPVFGIYVVMLVTRWLLNDVGGLARMEELNRDKARLLYDAIDGSGGFYQGHAHQDCRSLMNVTFRLPDADAERAFLKGAESKRLHQLKGHRSVGGIRASIYNAMPREGVALLADFMRDFAAGR